MSDTPAPAEAVPCTVRVARSRALPIILLAAVGAIGATGTLTLAAPAWSITPSTDANLVPGAPFPITSAFPAVTSTAMLAVSGIAGAGGAVTVEAVNAGDGACAAIAVFIVVVEPMSDTWGEMSAPYCGWMALFVAFTAVAMGVCVAFKLAPAALAAQEGEHRLHHH